MTVAMGVSGTTASQKLFSPAFLQDTLTQEVHRLLSLQYARPILEALSDHPEGLDTRWLDVRVVGVDGSARTAYVLVGKLEGAGWVESRVGSKPKRWILTTRGKEALAFAQHGDLIGKRGVGAN